jgi:hypothetical protein
MLGGSRLRAIFAALAVLTASVALAGTASASGGAAAIEAQDACDPATFGPDGCARSDDSGRRVTFDDAIAELTKTGAHGAWRFKSDDITVERGAPVTVRHGRGGEFHTFTKVPEFGLGCIPELNLLSLGSMDVNALCNDIVDVTARGASRAAARGALRRAAPRRRAPTRSSCDPSQPRVRLLRDRGAANPPNACLPGKRDRTLAAAGQGRGPTEPKETGCSGDLAFGRPLPCSLPRPRAWRWPGPPPLHQAAS